MDWLKNLPSLPDICEKLYGSKDMNTFSKFNKKVRNKYGNQKNQGFSPQEMLKLDEIRMQIIQETMQLTTEEIELLTRIRQKPTEQSGEQ